MLALWPCLSKISCDHYCGIIIMELATSLTGDGKYNSVSFNKLIIYKQ